MTPEKAAELIEQRRKYLEEHYNPPGWNEPELRQMKTTWEEMIARCRNPRHKSWAAYGGRGIKVCARWEDFLAFVRDMGKKPSPAHTLDRINNDGDYEPDNVRWATPDEQRLNGVLPHLVKPAGVYLQKGKYWVAMGYSKGKAVCLYCGDSAEKAVEARLAWERRKFLPSP